ncbi:MAG: dephospho-CoA kinase [Oligoflexia bacterium]|nr:dephospho-CoA kinase [Oligoflexia bacterium]
MSELKDDLQSPRAFPSPIPARVDLAETHISWVFLGEREVFKVKKPVNLGFLDFSTIDRRKGACEAEVALNARMAPGIYLGVVPVRKSPAGAYFIDAAGSGAGEIVDWAVRMRRLPEANRADVLLSEGKLDFPQVARLASKIAEFHAHARADAEISRFGDPQLIEFNIRENFDQTRSFIQTYLSAEEAEELENWQLSFLRQNSEVFQARVRDGHIRDGHGDLRLQQIYIGPEGQIVVLDCIEFNDRFRYGDVASDLAFLSMDLAFHGRADLAEHLLARYAREMNDFNLFSVVDFYESYRAHVRAKVAGLITHDSGIPYPIRSQVRHEARHYFLLALAFCRRSLIHPAVIAIGGTLASGKSTIADWMGERLSAPIIDADRTRKHLLGVAPTRFVGGPKWKGAYSLAMTKKVYDELFRRAEVILDSGRSVILDASFRSAKLRKLARELARAHQAPFRFIECTAPTSICHERLLKREHQSSISDARAGLLDSFSKNFEPINELPPDEHVVLDTSQSIEASTRPLNERLPLWPPGFAA